MPRLLCHSGYLRRTRLQDGGLPARIETCVRDLKLASFFSCLSASAILLVWGSQPLPFGVSSLHDGRTQREDNRACSRAPRKMAPNRLDRERFGVGSLGPAQAPREERRDVAA